jgi:hypothetical protein
MPENLITPKLRAIAGEVTTFEKNHSVAQEKMDTVVDLKPAKWFPQHVKVLTYNYTVEQCVNELKRAEGEYINCHDLKKIMENFIATYTNCA